MIRSLLIFALFVFCSCNKDQTEPANIEIVSPVSKNWIKDIIRDNDYWFYLTAVPFVDGGSVALGFMNSDGVLLHVFFDYSISHDLDYRRCYIQRSYNDSEAIELGRGSELEVKVISIIKDARLPKELSSFLPDRDKAIEILEKRDIDLRLTDEAESVPPRKRVFVPRRPVPPR